MTTSLQASISGPSVNFPLSSLSLAGTLSGSHQAHYGALTQQNVPSKDRVVKVLKDLQEGQNPVQRADVSLILPPINGINDITNVFEYYLNPMSTGRLTADSRPVGEFYSLGCPEETTLFVLSDNGRRTRIQVFNVKLDIKIPNSILSVEEQQQIKLKTFLASIDVSSRLAKHVLHKYLGIPLGVGSVVQGYLI